MKKKLGVFIVIVLLIAAGGFFYWWIPNHQPDSSPNPPTLFGKGDYKVEDRVDGKYIVVDKVGLTAKVPNGWSIEFEGSDYPESEYWVNLCSPDIATTTSYVLTDGCGISISVGTEEENNREAKTHVKLLQENPDIKPKEISYIYEGYMFKTTKIGNIYSLFWIAPEHPIIGRTKGIDIPIGKKELIDIIIASAPGYEEKCSPIWETFIENLKIK